MEEIKCPVCSRKIKYEEFSEWIRGWSDEQWKAPEWRIFLIGEATSGHEAKNKLCQLETLYEEQKEYIKTLERQLELLQKTLDIAERFAPRPLVIPNVGEVIHNGRSPMDKDIH